MYRKGIYMDFSKKENIDKLNEIRKINLRYKTKLPISLLVKTLKNLNKIKIILLKKNLFPIHHSLIVMFYPNCNKNNVYNLIFKFFRKNSGYPYILIYEENENLMKRFFKDKSIPSDVKNKILYDRNLFVKKRSSYLFKTLWRNDLSDHVFIFPGLMKNLKLNRSLINYLNSNNATIIFSIEKQCEIYLKEFKDLQKVHITKIEDSEKHLMHQNRLKDLKIFQFLQWLKLDLGIQKLNSIEYKNYKYVHKLRTDIMYMQPHKMVSKEYIELIDKNYVITQTDLSFSANINMFKKFSKILSFFISYLDNDPYSLDYINVNQLRNSDYRAFKWQGFPLSREILFRSGLIIPEIISDYWLYKFLISKRFEFFQKILYESKKNSNNKRDIYLRSQGFSLPSEMLYAKFLNKNNIYAINHEGVFGRIIR